jgi:hypothetical protein
MQRAYGNRAVLRLPGVGGAPRAAGSEGPVQRQQEEEESLQSKAVQRQLPEEEEEPLQAKPGLQRVGMDGGPVPPEAASAIALARGGGQSLDGAVQAQMGEAMGYDFSGVRVHTDAGADKLNKQLSAKAFTTGSDIFFKRGAYEPGSSSGRELIAHELSHVVQQSTGRVTGVGSGMTVRPAGDALEREADRVPAARTASIHTLVQRQTYDGRRGIPSPPVVQRTLLDPDKLNVAGENHGRAKGRRDIEKAYAAAVLGQPGLYDREKGFRYGVGGMKRGDPNELILAFRIQNVARLIDQGLDEPTPRQQRRHLRSARTKLGIVDGSIATDAHLKIRPGKNLATVRTQLERASADLRRELNKVIQELGNAPDLDAVASPPRRAWLQNRMTMLSTTWEAASYTKSGAGYESTRMDRSIAVFIGASKKQPPKGVWKVGNNHIIDVRAFLVDPKTQGRYMNERGNAAANVQFLDKDEYLDGLRDWIGNLDAAAWAALSNDA